MNIIACVDKNWGIGNNNQLLFHLPEDMQFFKEKTKGKYVIVGRKTFESLDPSYLKSGPKEILLLSRNKDYFKYENIDLSSIKVFLCEYDILNYLNKNGIDTKDVFVIGGAEIYKLFFPIVKDCYITEVKSVTDSMVDTYFPIKLSDFPLEWKLMNSYQGDHCVSIGTDYRFNHYKRREGSW